MVSNKILFLVLVGCAVALAGPVKREEENNVAETQQPEVTEQSESQEPLIEIEVHEITKEEFEEIYQKIQDEINKIIEEVNSHLHLQDSFDEIKKFWEKFFGEKKDSEESVGSDETVAPVESGENKENSVAVESVENKDKPASVESVENNETAEAA